jgi:hypothetical protein
MIPVTIKLKDHQNTIRSIPSISIYFNNPKESIKIRPNILENPHEIHDFPRFYDILWSMVILDHSQAIPLGDPTWL